MVLPHDRAHHVAIREADQRQIVVLVTAEYLEAGSRACDEARVWTEDRNPSPTSPCQIPAAGEANIAAGGRLNRSPTGQVRHPIKRMRNQSRK